MGKGLRSKAGRVLQIILLGANPNLFAPQGKRTICSNAEDYDYVESIEFDKLSRKGAKSLTANVPLEEMWQGKMSGPLHYNLIDDQILSFWIAKPTETPIVVGGVNCIDAEYVRPQLDRADRAYFAIEEGKPGTPIDMGCYGLFTSFKWTSKRGNKGTSRFEANFVTQAAVQRPNLTGGAAQNAILTITGTNVTTDGVLAVTRQGQPTEQITIHPGDATTTVKTAFEALNCIDGVTVVGTISAVTAASVVNQATNGNPSGNAVNDVNSYPANAFNLDNTTASNAWRAGSVAPVSLAYAKTAGYIVNRYSVHSATNGAAPAAWKFEGSLDATTATDGTWTTLDTRAGQVGSTTGAQFSIVNTVAYKAYRLNITAVVDGASAPVVAELRLEQVGSYVPGNGAITITVITPANTSIVISPVSGAGYTSAVTQQGGDGALLGAMLTEDPILPGHLFLYTSTTAAGLDDPTSMIGQIGEWELDDPKICMPVSHHIPIVDPERPNLPATYNAHAEEDAQEDGPKLSVTMDTDEDGVVDGMAGIVRASGTRTVSSARYWRIVAVRPNSPRFVRVDFYGSIGSTAERKFGGVIEQRTFVFDLLENKEVGWNFKVKTRRPA